MNCFDRLAWSVQIRRTTPPQRQALMGFVAAWKKIGAGTGKQQNANSYNAATLKRREESFTFVT